MSYSTFLKKIAHSFKDEGLLERALTHRSAAKTHNERLEFLGDAVLGLVIAEALFEQFPKQPEGKLTRMRSSLVKGDTLAEIALELELGSFIKLGSGELKSGGHRRASILADTVEAILGAIYLDGGLAATKYTILSLFETRLALLDPNIQIKDSKTQLQEFLQSRQHPLPVYTVSDIKGKDHAQIFTVECDVGNLSSTQQGVGKSRRIAEQIAAQKTLEKLTDG